MKLKTNSIEIFEQFSSKYLSVINKLFPELSDVCVECVETNESDKSPFGMPPHTLSIVRFKETASQYTEDEQLALIAHEIGHIMAEINQKDTNDQEEEKYADDTAVSLGLSTELKKAIEKMMNQEITNNSTDGYDKMLGTHYHGEKSNSFKWLQERFNRI